MTAALRGRAALLAAVRAFFAAQGFLEVCTPVRVRAPAPEEHINAVPAAGAWLRPSPELHLKRLVAAGHGRIYQLGPCFRHGEVGRRHREEFTLLEWYWAGAGYLELLAQTEALVAATAHALAGAAGSLGDGPRVDWTPPFARVTVDEAFRRWAGRSPQAAIAAGEFELDLVDKVEPQLPRDRPCFLLDYPIALGALARAKPDAPAWAERWELYAAGLELANAYGELTDGAEQRRRFAAATAARTAAGHPAYPTDEAFLAALDRGLPACAGCALGVDRLLMALTGATDIAAVLPFPDEPAG